MKDDLGDRMKMYEGIECERTLIPRLPIYARMDGKCFSNFTKNMKRPFDETMSKAMVETTKYLITETHALMGYTQSDEISLVWYHPEPKSESWLGGKPHKLISILASMTTIKFNLEIFKYAGFTGIPIFDCRVFNLPTLEEAANAFLWRELDATKNAVSMAASCYFSPNQLHGKTGSEKQEMLFQTHGINFNYYPEAFKRGTFVRRVTEERLLTPEEMEGIPEEYRPKGMVSRSKIVEMEMPRFASVVNRVGVIFNGEEPLVFL